MTEPVQCPPVPRRDREATERRLVKAALEILERDGVLAGLRLRDVAEHAGVSRGNIYNYFGNRRELLRRALHIRFTELGERFGPDDPGFVERKLRFVGGPTENHYATNVLSLLVLDHGDDDDVVAMPFFDNVMDGMRRSVETGDIHPDHAEDLEGLHIAISAATRGYNLLRPIYASQIGVSIEELDERVRTVIKHWLTHMAEPRETQRSEQHNHSSLTLEQDPS